MGSNPIGDRPSLIIISIIYMFLTITEFLFMNIYTGFSVHVSHFILCMFSFILFYILFSCGLIKIFLNSNNIISFIIGLEIIMLSLAIYIIVLFNNTIFLTFGNTILLFILTLSVSEAALGLALLLRIFSIQYNADFKNLNSVNG